MFYFVKIRKSSADLKKMWDIFFFYHRLIKADKKLFLISQSDKNLPMAFSVFLAHLAKSVLCCFIVVCVKHLP